VTVAYSEIDPYCVKWLRNLMENGFIARGEVCDVSIKQLPAASVRAYGNALCAPQAIEFIKAAIAAINEA
jgi:hypothetical protein